MLFPTSSETASTKTLSVPTGAESHQRAPLLRNDRKRSIAVSQVAETAMLPSHLSQSEPEFTPSIKRRCTTNNASTRVLVNPKSVDNAPPELETDHQTLISKFTESQQNELKAHLNNTKIQAVLKSAEALLKTLKVRNIELSLNRRVPPAPSLFAVLRNFSIIKEAQTVTDYFAKANTFFFAVNNHKITKTNSLTNMFNSKAHIKEFAKIPDDSIQAFAANPNLKRIMSIHNNKGVPIETKEKEPLSWPPPLLPELIENVPFVINTDRRVLISKFTLPQQNEINTHLNNKKVQAVLMSAETLLKTLKNRSITLGLDQVKPHAATLFYRLKRFSIVNDALTLSYFFAKANTFFSAVNNQQITRTSSLTSMLRTNTHIKQFATMSIDNIQTIAESPCLQQITSMCNGRGLPEAAKVEALLSSKCWELNGEFSIELLRAFSSMCNGKGLPNKAAVEAVIAWECWKTDGQFNLELLKVVSSLKSTTGLPNKEETESLLAWNCWKVNDKFNLELFRTISSMQRRKGFPDKAKVEAVLSWECWIKDGKFNQELLCTFFSIFCSKDIPDKAKAEAALSWDCWKVDGKFSLERLQTISSIYYRQGLPNKEKVEAFFQWLPSDQDKYILKLAYRLFYRFGLPSVDKLTKHEKALRRCLEEYGCGNKCSGLIKPLSLFFSGPEKWLITITEIQQYLTAHNNPQNVHIALQALLRILTVHGKAGVQFWFKKHHENTGYKKLLTPALCLNVPLAFTQFALTQLPEYEQREYLELCRKLKPAPTLEQWNALKSLRQQLGQRFKLTKSVRMMLEILWHQKENHRAKYIDKVDDLLKTVPTLHQWCCLSQEFKPSKMKLFMDACLDYQAQPESVPAATTQLHLLEGMLLTRHYLPECTHILDLCFLNRISTGDKKGVIINGESIMSGTERQWHFITAMLFELQQTEYHFKNQILTIMPFNGEPVVFEKPIFTFTDSSLVIKNWTVEQLTAFFQATEFSERWYKQPNDKRDLSSINPEPRIDTMKTPAKNLTTPKPNKITSLLSPSVIINTINKTGILKSAAWSSLEYYANNDMLTTSLCTALSPMIENDSNHAIPELIKTAVAKKLQQANAKNTATTMQETTSIFSTTMKVLNSFETLGNGKLELLEPYRTEMTDAQLNTVQQKVNYNDVDEQTLNRWCQDVAGMNEDPLGLLSEIWNLDDDLLLSDSALSTTGLDSINSDDDCLLRLLQE